jgi:glucose/arabinose dehydrogenase
MPGMKASLPGLALLALACACSSSSNPVMPPPVDANATAPTWCERGVDVVGATAPDGFCIKQFATVREARALVVAPNGDVFVAGPSRPTAGGATGGPGAILVLADDNHDGLAEAHVFLQGLEDVHGLALGGGNLYYTTQGSVWRTPYVDGQRASSGASEDLKLPGTFGTGGRWTHGLARSAGGQLVTSRGAYGMCDAMGGSAGDISNLAEDGTMTQLATGLRNPMYLRCHRTDEVCAAMELGEDLLTGAVEKMLLIKPSTNYGYPCCTTKAAPIPAPPADVTAICAAATKEEASFPLSDTPFGFDWEPGNWPAPYQNGVFVALHGSFYSNPSWEGAGVVYAPTDPTTHAPVADWMPFQTGFGFGGSILDRPSDVAFGSDGRMFVSDDQSGYVYWIAPTSLMAPAAPTN